MSRNGRRAPQIVLLVLCSIVPVAASRPGGSTQPSPGLFVLMILVYVTVPSAIFCGVVTGVMQIARVIPNQPNRIRPIAGPALLVVGALLGVNELVSVVPSFLGGQLPWLGLGCGFVVMGVLLSTATVRNQARFGSLVGGACLAVLVAGVVTAVQSTVLHSLTLATTVRVVFVLPLFGLLPAGYAFGRDDRRLGVLTAATAFAVPMLGLTIVGKPGFGTGLLLLLLAVVYGLGITVIGSPLLAIGSALSGRSS